MPTCATRIPDPAGSAYYSLLPIPCSLYVAARLPALFQIALVVIFGAPEGLGGFDFGHNTFGLEAAFGGELLDLSAGLCFLLGGVEEDGGAVLRAPVRALAVECGGVVEGEEGVEKLFEADAVGVEVEFDDLGVAGLVGADVLVGGAVELAALIPDGSGGYARNGGKGRFNSPETAGAEGCFFLAHES